MSRLPDPSRCEPCALAAAEMDTGLMALLDKLATEADVTGELAIVSHASELRRLLSARASKALPFKGRRALDEKRPRTQADPPIPPYVAAKVTRAKELPPLPHITKPYSAAVFTHRSFTNDARARGLDAGSDYERLEFLGDAYIEIIASRILYSRFPHVDVPQQSHLREQLVKNETLARFSESYALGDRLRHGGHMSKSKAWDKIIADIFEAYVAAIVLSDPARGFQTAEAWLTDLWAPQLLGFKERMIENPKAREELQNLIVGRGAKLDYRDEKPMQMHRGLQRFFVGVHLTGWGFENVWLGSGVGQNKTLACVDAANDALERSEVLGVIPTAHRRKLEAYPPRAEAEGEGAVVIDLIENEGDASDESAERNSMTRLDSVAAVTQEQRRQELNGESSGKKKKMKKKHPLVLQDGTMFPAE
ncbi:ribonuclease III [Melanomma pulvis-pyrius CBS 109.77]|uniref:ribonuclease III n=1 Tax=Melanomma pulvis-pyrius CBS 109.77 TaxID=1314802 RepID=A0A6A6XVT1_9PLEO|nr:ribonuclease III [Melanomma pulvis-pyrius CBS 109.77]